MLSVNVNHRVAENDGYGKQELLEGPIIIVAASKRILALAVNRVDHRPPQNRQTKIRQKLSQWEPRGVDLSAIVDGLVEVRAF